MRVLNEQLATARVHIGGAGRIGTGIVLALHASGVGRISCNDPQNFEEEQLQICAFSRRSDVGRPKVYVLERFLDGRAGFIFEPIVAPNESPRVAPFLKQADLIISCANKLGARLHLEEMAIRLSKPSIQAAAQDSRQVLGGVISLWVPTANCSCFGCLFPDQRPQLGRSEILLPAVTGTIANLAAHLAVQLLTASAAGWANRHNVFTVDLQACTIASMSVQPRVNCSICNPRKLRRGR